MGAGQREAAVADAIGRFEIVGDVLRAGQKAVLGREEKGDVGGGHGGARDLATFAGEKLDRAALRGGGGQAGGAGVQRGGGEVTACAGQGQKPVAPCGGKAKAGEAVARGGGELACGQGRGKVGHGPACGAGAAIGKGGQSEAVGGAVQRDRQGGGGGDVGIGQGEIGGGLRAEAGKGGRCRSGRDGAHDARGQQGDGPCPAGRAVKQAGHGGDLRRCDGGALHRDAARAAVARCGGDEGGDGGGKAFGDGGQKAHVGGVARGGGQRQAVAVGGFAFDFHGDAGQDKQAVGAAQNGAAGVFGAPDPGGLIADQGDGTGRGAGGGDDGPRIALIGGRAGHLPTVEREHVAARRAGQVQPGGVDGVHFARHLAGEGVDFLHGHVDGPKGRDIAAQRSGADHAALPCRASAVDGQGQIGVAVDSQGGGATFTHQDGAAAIDAKPDSGAAEAVEIH